MMESTLHPTPGAREVLIEQVRTVGLALRMPAVVAAALAGIATLLGAVEFLARGGAPVDFAPELSMLPGIVGLLLPIGVWMGEDRFGAGFLWTLPVDRGRHALTRVFAGWLWLMASVSLVFLWLLALALLTGGNLLDEQTVRLLPSPSVPAPGTLDPASLRPVAWTPQPLLWLVPFTAATGTYLLSSALSLGVRHPLRWIVGILLGLLLAHGAGTAAQAEWLRTAPLRVLEEFYLGPYGLDALLTARAESLRTEVALSTGDTVPVWRGLPDLREWATATLLWTSAGAAALWAAAARHRERRRA